MSVAPMSAPVMQVDNLHMQFKRRRSMVERLSGQPARIVHALNGVSFTVARGETLGIVGESGCGK
jgi:ABC-type oligopeptide transport system ATPase subunit